MFIRRITCNLSQLSKNYAYKSHGTEPAILLPQILPFSNKAILNRHTPATEIDPETGKPKKKKSPIIPRITLLSGNDISVSTLEEAQKLAKRRDLKLVKIVDLDTKTQRPVYRLMTGAEYHKEDLKQREKKKSDKQTNTLKGEKVLMLNQNISEHDLQIHVNKVVKWLAKRYEVRMVIHANADSIKKAEEVYAFLEKSLSAHGRIVQKRQKGTDIKFQVVPPKEPKNTNESSDNIENKGGSSKETTT